MQDRAEEREFFIDNLLVRIHFIIEMIWWTGLAPWEFEFPFPGSLIYLPRTEHPSCVQAASDAETVGAPHRDRLRGGGDLSNRTRSAGSDVVQPQREVLVSG